MQYFCFVLVLIPLVVKRSGMIGAYIPIEYLPVLILAAIGIGFGVVNLFVSWLLRPSNRYKAKLDPYECGVDPVSDAHERFSVRFYILAMLFLLFDVEAIFLYPWAVVYKSIGLYGFFEMVIFIIILVIGYAYAWRKGALEWE